MEINYLNSKESFGMFGPWIGQLQIENQTLDLEFFDNNHVKNEDGLLYAFNRFQYKKVKVKFLFNPLHIIHTKREFRILLFDKMKDKWYVSNADFESLYLTRLEKGQIYFTNAFHSNNQQIFPEKQIAFNDNYFTEINQTEILNKEIQYQPQAIAEPVFI